MAAARTPRPLRNSVTPSAVIVRANLPPDLESIRQSSVTDAAAGVPAHVTLLHPFVGWEELDPSIGRKIASIAARHAAFDYTMTGPERWPDTVYVALEPVEPFIRLQADLAATFPEHPIYGEESDFEFSPHITVAEGRFVDDAMTLHEAAWSALPLRARADWLDVIATNGAKWDLVWRVQLGRSDRTAIATIRP